MRDAAYSIVQLTDAGEESDTNDAGTDDSDSDNSDDSDSG